MSVESWDNGEDLRVQSIEREFCCVDPRYDPGLWNELITIRYLWLLYESLPAVLSIDEAKTFRWRSYDMEHVLCKPIPPPLDQRCVHLAVSLTTKDILPGLANIRVTVRSERS
jgi:hypothetical protein